MSLIGNDFKLVVAPFAFNCGECGNHIPAGGRCLESVRFGKVQKRVCSEDCRVSFDDRYWQERADQRKAGEAA
jgi:hypothetical protein